MTRRNTLFLSLIGFMVSCYVASGQSFNMSYQGSDTTTLCNGTLYDHGGPTGNYSDGAHGYYYLDVPGGTLNITFTSLSTESCCDRVRIYDGLGTSGTMLLNAGGYSLPNGGNPINIPSGKATIYFYSDGSVTGQGFALNWSGGGTTAPQANFSLSNPNPPVNIGVNFTNTSTNSGSYIWDFGDGTSSTATSPTHAFANPGTYSVKLIASNCIGTDTSSVQNLTVMASPEYYADPDSVYASVSCGGGYSGSFVIRDTAGGTMYYNLSSVDHNASPAVVSEDFETGLGVFQLDPNASGGFTASAVIGNAAQGNGSVLLAGSTNSYDGLFTSFPNTQPTELSYYIKPSNSNYHGYFALSNNSAGYYEHVLISYIRYGNIYVSSGFGTYSYTIPQNQYSRVEARNIDWTNRTFDFYLNGVLQMSGMPFISNTITGVNEINLWNNYAVTCYFDKIELTAQPVSSGPGLSPSSGVLSNGNNQTVNFSGSTAGMLAGRYLYDILIHTNASGADSLTTVPLVLDVTGSAVINLDQSCINYGNVFTGQMDTSTVMIYNTGCDSLDISSITSSNADFSLSHSSLIVEPYDTAYLMVMFNASSAAAYNDTIYLTNNGTDTTICLSATGVNPPIISTDSSTYNLTSLGCNDSIPFTFKIYNDGGSDLDWNLIFTSATTDDFENGLNTSLWQSLGSAVITTSCFVNSGSNALFFNGYNRYAETVPLNLAAGDSIRFWIAPGANTGNCERPDGGENLYLEYSTNGVYWTTLQSFSYTQPAGFVSYVVPSGAVSTTTRLRFRQTTYSLSNGDNWMVDDFSLVSGSASGSFTPSSGTVTAADSVSVSGYLDVANLNSGTYTRSMKVFSNDPADSIHTVNINLNIIGEPDIQLQSSCLAFGNVMNGTTAHDSVLVYNSGCADLVISGNTVTNADFSFSAPVSTIAPGDSAMLFIDYTPTSLGAVNDTIFVNNNDTTGIICLTGIGQGAPNASVNPDSIYMNFTSCSDSAIIPIKLKNMGGQDTLLFSVLGTTNSGKPEVVTLANNAYSSQYNGLKTLLGTYTSINWSESFATSASTLQNDLANADVLIIPERSNTNLSTLAPTIRDFANNGKTVIICLNYYANLSTLNMIGGSSTDWAGSILTNIKPNHPIMKNVSITSSAPSATWEAYVGPSAEILMTSSSAMAGEAVVAVDDYGQGKVAWLGFSFNYYNPEQELMLEQAIHWGTGPELADYLTLTPDTGFVAVDDSITVNLKINTLGLQNGNYSSVISINTNDPANPVIEIPVVVDVAGAAEVAVIDTSCISFSSILQGATATDSVNIYNTGCDTLTVNSFTSSMSDFGIGSLPMTLAPGDTMPVLVEFTPVGVGTFNDTIVVNTNDTSFSICVSGSSVGAPVLDLPVDSLVVEVNKCKIIKNETFKIRNTGQGAMTYGMSIGGYYGVSQKSYNTSGAQTVHTFTGVPQSDTLRLRIILHGDYDSYYERTYLNIDNSYYYGRVYHSNKNYVNDTIEYMWYGNLVQNWTADGTLSFDLSNTTDVDGGAGSFHRVEVSLSSSVNWVSVVGATSGNIGAGATANKNMLFNAAGLSVGTYNTILNITTNTPGQPSKAVPVVMKVVEEPELSVSDTCVIFPMTLLGDTATRTLTVYNDGCMPLNVSSILPGNSDFKITPSNGSIPIDDSLQVTVKFIPTTITTYSSSILINSNDTSAILCLQAMAGATPIADFQFSYQNGCLGEVVFADESQYTPSSWFWDFGDGNISTQRNPTHQYAKPGTYKVTLRVTNNVGFDTTSTMIIVNPLYVNFSMTNDTVFTNTTVSFYDSSAVPVSWDWNFGDGTTATTQNPTHSFANKGKYQVSLEVKDARGCVRTETKNLYVKSDIGVEEYTVDGHSYDVYPNPGSGLFYLDAEGMDWSDYQLQVIDARGSMIRSIERPDEGAKIQLDLSGLKAGVYQLMILKGGEMKGRQSLIIK